MMVIDERVRVAEKSKSANSSNKRQREEDKVEIIVPQHDDEQIANKGAFQFEVVRPEDAKSNGERTNNDEEELIDLAKDSEYPSMVRK